MSYIALGHTDAVGIEKLGGAVLVDGEGSALLESLSKRDGLGSMLVEVVLRWGAEAHIGPSEGRGDPAAEHAGGVEGCKEIYGAGCQEGNSSIVVTWELSGVAGLELRRCM